MGKGNKKFKGRGKKGSEKSGKKGVYRGSKKDKKSSFKKKTDKTSAKNTFCFNRYRDKERMKEELKKKQMLEEKIEQQYQSSESEEDVQDPIQQLLSTFQLNEKYSKKPKAIDSSEESEDDMVLEEDKDLSELDEEEIENNEEESADSDHSSLIIDEDNEMESDGHANGLNDSKTLNGSNLKLFLENENQHDQMDNDEELIPAGQKVVNDNKQTDFTNFDTEDLSLTDDPFTQHLQDDLHDSLLLSISKKPPIVETASTTWPCLGKLIFQIPKSKQSEDIKDLKKSFTILEDKSYTKPGAPPTKIIQVDWNSLYVKTQIQPNLASANKMNLFKKECELTDKLTPLQKELFSIMNNYQDLLYSERTFVNGDEIRFAYCLHALNHLIKTRTKILHHNAKLNKKSDASDEFRDQGLVRPKVIILVPFKDCAYRIVKMFIAILGAEEGSQVVNKNRFEDDFTGNEINMPKKNPKPEDYELTFAGNSDDKFRMGLSITKKTLKLYSDFYSSDLIIASPLGLRVIVGADGEEERDFDFLASVELLIMDQTEIFLMQNWDHLLHILDHFHLQPKKTHGTDFSRLRSWAVNGWTKYYRQTLIFSSISLPEINSVFNKKCFNYAGKVRIHNPIDSGTIRQVAVQIPQVFRKIEAKDPVSAIDARFDYFIKEIIPQYKDNIMAHTMIFVPSYFDYVRIRNHFKKEDTSFVQICEYSKDAKIARARDMFFHTEAHFLLYSERFHFFRRMRIKGIRHIIFYQPPVFPNFYSELCNLMQEGNQNKFGGSESNMTVTLLYTKYDLQQLSAIVGTERTTKMCQSERNVHMFTTGE